MAKKAELLEQANKLGLEVTEKHTIAEIEAAIAKAPEAETEAPAAEEKLAKAGKRSAKAVKESEEKEAKEQRKASAEEQPEKPKQKQNPSKTQLERKGKKYRELAKLIDSEKEYSLKEAVELATKTSPVKFDASVELHINLGVDPRHADQNIRGTVALPAGTGKTIRIAVFADDEKAAAAKKAGADIVGEEAVTKMLEKGTLDFDVLISTPQMMGKLGKHARTLGPKGLMPNPKSGTVTNDVVKAVAEAKAGRVEFRVDSTGIVHIAFGKVSFGTDKLMQNLTAVTTSIRSAKPSSIKGNYVKAVYLTTAMGPSIRVVTSEI
jgi:large subunit ribosomal protein L1